MEIQCGKRGAGRRSEERVPQVRRNRSAGGDVKGWREAKEKSGGVAAFFDLDGTLLGPPSLERSLFRILRCRRAIPAKNYLLWLGEAMRLVPRGISAILQANKMYLRGAQILDLRGEGDRDGSSWQKDSHQAEGQASASLRRHPRLPVRIFFAQAIDRVAWHGKQGHEI